MPARERDKHDRTEHGGDHAGGDFHAGLRAEYRADRHVRAEHDDDAGQPGRRQQYPVPGQARHVRSEHPDDGGRAQTYESDRSGDGDGGCREEDRQQGDDEARSADIDPQH